MSEDKDTTITIQFRQSSDNVIYSVLGYCVAKIDGYVTVSLGMVIAPDTETAEDLMLGKFMNAYPPDDYQQYGAVAFPLIPMLQQLANE